MRISKKKMTQATFLFDIICTWMIVRKSFLNYSSCTQEENIFKNKQGRVELLTKFSLTLAKLNETVFQLNTKY
jgi:hypothetical protein